MSLKHFVAGILFISPLTLPVNSAEWSAFDITASPSPAAGMLWLRCFVRPEENMVTPAERDLWRDSMTLTVRAVPGNFTVSLNGQQIIASGPLVPDKPGRFKVPKGILEKGVFNVISIRIEGGAGLSETPVFAGYFNELKLGPAWQKTTLEPAVEELKPVAQQPASAFYTEADFHPATTPMEAAPELVRGKFVSRVAALAALETDAGFAVDELLHEPQIAQPTHVSYDGRGRAWVSQYRQYPTPTFANPSLSPNETTRHPPRPLLSTHRR